LKHVQLIRLGKSYYGDAWNLQKNLFQQVVEKRSAHYLLLTEHHPVITVGQKSNPSHLLADEVFLQKQGIELFHIDRGGDVTFHGPGQLVCYPILNLLEFKQDVHWYLRALEEIVLLTLADFRISAQRIPQLTGIWIGDKKICALGIKVTRWVSMHGFALNISTNLDYFQYIVPCGIQHKGVTSVLEQTGNIIAVNDVSQKVIAHFAEIFGVTVRSAGTNETQDETASPGRTDTVIES
jgi:lipoyl(octanoyl) transferase